MKKVMIIGIGVIVALIIYDFINRAVTKNSSSIVDRYNKENPKMPDSFNDLNPKKNYYFERIGYFKQNRNRIITYYVSSANPIYIDSIPESLWDRISSHASTEMYTDGKITQVLYYLNKALTPDPTSAGDYFTAIEMVYNAKPICVYSRGVDGEVQFEKFPE